MTFRSVVGRMGNMRKDVDWVIYPLSSDAEPNTRTRTIQSDKRIAKIDLDTGDAILSSGKGGHQGRAMLHPKMGATLVKCPQDIIDQIIELEADKGPQKGPVRII